MRIANALKHRILKKWD